MRSKGATPWARSTKAAKTADFLYRYMWARHRCVGAPAPSAVIWLAYLIEWGKKKFDNVYVEPDESPSIVWDNQHPAFLSAMFKMDYDDMPRPTDLAARRTYVLYNSLPPERPEGRPEPAALVGAGSAPLQDDPIAEVWSKPPMTGDAKPANRNWQLDPVRPRVARSAHYCFCRGTFCPFWSSHIPVVMQSDWRRWLLARQRPWLWIEALSQKRVQTATC